MDGPRETLRLAVEGVNGYPRCVVFLAPEQMEGRDVRCSDQVSVLGSPPRSVRS
jgi:hypothetical protein